MTDTAALSVKFTTRIRSRKPHARRVPEATAAAVTPTRTQAYWTKQRNTELAIYGEIAPTSLYYSETAPAAWLEAVTA